jgi:hypothetical protein
MRGGFAGAGVMVSTAPSLGRGGGAGGGVPGLGPVRKPVRELEPRHRWRRLGVGRPGSACEMRRSLRGPRSHWLRLPVMKCRTGIADIRVRGLSAGTAISASGGSWREVSGREHYVHVVLWHA